MNVAWMNIAEGDKETFSELYVLYYKKFFNYGKKFTDDVPLLEDVIQELLINLWTRRVELKKISNPHNYFFTAFRHSLFKKLKESNSLPIENGHLEPEFSVDAIIIQHENDLEREAKLKEALRALTSRQREAIYLRFYEGLSYEEVAATLNITVKATYKIMARALSELKTNLSVSYAMVLFWLRNLL